MSNITDAGPDYVGTETTLRLLCPLLQTPQRNPHATIITQYLNATQQIVKSGTAKDQAPNTEALGAYLPFDPKMIFNTQGAAMYKYFDARNAVLDRNKYFNK